MLEWLGANLLLDAADAVVEAAVDPGCLKDKTKRLKRRAKEAMDRQKQEAKATLLLFYDDKHRYTR